MKESCVLVSALLACGPFMAPSITLQEAPAHVACTALTAAAEAVLHAAAAVLGTPPSSVLQLGSRCSKQQSRCKSF